MITTGILSSIKIQNLDGSFQLDLGGTGGCKFYSYGKKAIDIFMNQLNFYNWAKDGDFSGAITTYNYALNPDKPMLTLWHDYDASMAIMNQKSDGKKDYYVIFDNAGVIGMPCPISIYKDVCMNNYKIYLGRDKTKYITVMADGNMYFHGDINVNGNVKYSGDLQKVNFS